MDPISTRTLLATVGGTVPEEYWYATLVNTYRQDVAEDVAVDSLGNVYITGWYRDVTGNILRKVVAKYDASGVIQWQRMVYNTGDDTKGRGVEVDSSGNIYAAGRTDLGGIEKEDAFIVKYNSSGVIQWQRRLVGASDRTDSFQAIAIDSSNNIYAAGNKVETNTYGDMLLVKYNASGTLQWQRGLGTSDADTQSWEDVKVDSSGNIYAVGIEYAGSNNYCLVAKYNSSGTLQWQRRLGSGDNDYGLGVAVDGSGNVYVILPSNSFGDQFTYRTVVAKYNSSGTIQWQKYFSNTTTSFTLEQHSISIDNQGDIITCSVLRGVTSNDGIAITKINSSGTLQWARYLSPTSSSYGLQPHGLSLDSSGNIYISGKTTLTATGYDDMIVFKLPGDGSLTGTYGSVVYSVFGLTLATSSLGDISGSLTASTTSLTSSTASLTEAASSLTSSTTTL